DPDSLYRLLRGLASLGVVAETVPGSFILTSLGLPLRKDSPNSVWPSVVFWADLLADSWSYLTDCVRTGKTSMEVMESQGIASRWSKDPDAPAIFRAVMGSGPAEDYMPIVESWDFSASRIVADVGGGGGALIRAILTRYPGLKGMLVDRPQAVEQASPKFESEGLADRTQLIAADLLESVPSGADTYLIKHVLHGYTDDVAVNVLENCRKAMKPEGRLLVIEFVLPDVVAQPDPEIEVRVMSDLNMMAVTGGKERSAGEWSRLLLRSGFKPQRIIPVSESHPGQEVSIIEAFLSDSSE
ncbi:MAG: methyltransferase, partial [Blastocatellia bacterium]